MLDLIPSQAPGIKERFPWIPAAAYAESLQVVREADGRTWAGAAAVEEVIRSLRAGWLVSWLFRLPFARAMSERMYRWFAMHRDRLSCGDHCDAHTISPATGTKNS